MNALAEDWVEKAEEDYGSAGVLLPYAALYPSVICYHYQQSAEKYLKAFIMEQNIFPPRIHNLLSLMNGCATYDSSFHSLYPQLDLLTQYAVDFRYPGADANDVEARDAYQAATDVRTFVRSKLFI